MKKLLISLAIVMGIMLFCGNQAMAVDQVVAYAVSNIDQFGVSGTPSLTVDTATAGGDPVDDQDTTSSYSITSNVAGGSYRKITGKLQSALTTGLTLKVNLAAPGGGGSSAGTVSLITSDQDLVTSITKQKATAKQITYTLSATADVDGGTSGNATVVYTFTSQS